MARQQTSQHRMKRGAAPLLTALLVVGALPQSVDARHATETCRRFRSPGLYDFPADRERIATMKPSVVADRHTEADPLTFEFHHEPVVGTIWPVQPWVFVVEPVNEYFNIQVTTSKRSAVLNARLEWPTPSLSNIDLGLYDARGGKVIWSEAWNNAVLDAVIPVPSGKNGGPGFEEIADIPISDCAGFTLVSAPHNNLGEDMTLKVWLSTPGR